LGESPWLELALECLPWGINWNPSLPGSQIGKNPWLRTKIAQGRFPIRNTLNGMEKKWNGSLVNKG